MPKVGSVFDAGSEDNYRTNCNADGSCSGCGECCSDFLPLSDQEIKTIRNYLKANPIKPHRNVYAVLRQSTADMTCPFRDNVSKKCDIYEVRPLICRSFICTKKIEDAKRDRDIVSEKRKVSSMRKVFFGDDGNESMLRSVSLAITEAFARSGF